MSDCSSHSRSGDNYHVPRGSAGTSIDGCGAVVCVCTAICVPCIAIETLTTCGVVVVLNFLVLQREGEHARERQSARESERERERERETEREGERERG